MGVFSGCGQKQTQMPGAQQGRARTFPRQQTGEEWETKYGWWWRRREKSLDRIIGNLGTRIIKRKGDLTEKEC